MPLSKRTKLREFNSEPSQSIFTLSFLLTSDLISVNPLKKGGMKVAAFGCLPFSQLQHASGQRCPLLL